MPYSWYRRMGDIPGINYEPPFPVEREKLPGHDATARVEEDPIASEVLGYERKRVRWTIPGVEYASGSPASHVRREFQERRGQSCSQLLRSCIETLELPGEPDDYHWALQTTAGQIADSDEAIADPQWDQWAEWLWLLNIRLAEVCPDAVTIPRTEGQTARIPVLGIASLSTRYLAEGWIQGALDLQRRAVAMGAIEDADKMTKRIEALQAEDAR